MKKIISILCFILGISLNSYAQPATIGWQIQQNNNLAKISQRLDSINLKLYKLDSLRYNVYSYSTTARSSNTAVAYATANLTVGNNTLTPASLFTLSIPNGLYEILNVDAFFAGNNRTIGVYFYNGTVTVGNDNAGQATSIASECAYGQGYCYFPGGNYIDQGVSFRTTGLKNISPLTTTFSGERKMYFNVTNNVIYYRIETTAGFTPTSTEIYTFMVRVLKIK
ncbi:exported hypothetical protein [Gammaproteobacteria bacterium]